VNRIVSVLLAVVLLGADAPANVPSAAPSADRLPALIGNWTCRAPDSTLSTLNVHTDSDAIVADATEAGDDVAERFTPDPATGGWRAAVQRRGPWTSLGHAPAWTEQTWTIVATVTRYGTYGNATFSKQTTYDLRPDGTLVRLTSYAGAIEPASGVVCARGNVPPPAEMCAMDDFPPTILHAAQPKIPLNRVNGIVRILVTIDPQGNPIDEKIVESPSSYLNASALSAVKRSRFRPGYHACEPATSTYLFSAEYFNGY
jgi:TonB family protein